MKKEARGYMEFIGLDFVVFEWLQLLTGLFPQNMVIVSNHVGAVFDHAPCFTLFFQYYPCD